jgi:uncharacterized protein (DUF58 family)
MFHWRDRRFPAIALLSLLLARTSGGAFFHLLFYFLLCYVVVAYLWMWYAARNLTVLLTPDRRTAVMGEHIPVRLRIYNEGLFPVPFLSARDLTPVERTFDITASLGPLSSAVLSAEWSGLRRGRRRLGPIELSISDPLGVMQVSVKDEVPGEFVVYPAFERLHWFPMPARQPYGHSRRPEPSAVDRTSVSELRQFREGDSQKMVDWKATARHRRLLVRRFDLLAGADVHIFLDMNAKSGAILGQDPEWVDRAAQSAVTIAEYALRHGEALSFHCCGTKYQRLHAARGSRQLSAVLEMAATAESGLNCDTMSVMHDICGALPSRSTIVLVSPRDDLSCKETLFFLTSRGHSVVQVICPEGETTAGEPGAFTVLVVPPGSTLASVLGAREQVMQGV